MEEEEETKKITRRLDEPHVEDDKLEEESQDGKARK